MGKLAPGLDPCYPDTHQQVVISSGFCLTSNMHVQDYDHFNLEVGYEDGRDRVLLWLPTICKHVITDESPLASWLKPSGIMADADATIIVVVSHSLLCTQYMPDILCMSPHTETVGIDCLS